MAAGHLKGPNVPEGPKESDQRAARGALGIVQIEAAKDQRRSRADEDAETWRPRLGFAPIPTEWKPPDGQLAACQRRPREFLGREPGKRIGTRTDQMRGAVLQQVKVRAWNGIETSDPIACAALRPS